jgi:hypothetical protein
MNIAAMMLMLTILFVGCLPRPAVETTHFDAALASAKPVCEQFFFPNSMARPPEFDVNAHQTELEQRIIGLSDTFRSVAGVEERAQLETDDVAKACVRKLLRHARETA